MSTPRHIEVLDCGCEIESPWGVNRWQVWSRGESCRFHIVGESLYIESGRYPARRPVVEQLEDSLPDGAK